MSNSTLSTTVKSQIRISLQNISTLGQIRGHKDTGRSNGILKYIQETIQLRKITSRRWLFLETIGSTKNFLKYRLIEPTNNREAKLRERGDASRIPVRVHWESRRGNAREASVSRVAFAFDKRVQVQFPNFPACHSSRRGRSLEYSSTTLRFLFLGLIPSAATLPSAQLRRLFKIPAGVPSSVLKITPTRLVCRFGPSLVDCDIALALLATSTTPIPDSPHPYFIRPFSTFPPCFLSCSDPLCFSPSSFRVRSFQPTHLFDLSRIRLLEGWGGTFFLGQFFETPLTRWADRYGCYHRVTTLPRVMAFLRRKPGSLILFNYNSFNFHRNL